MFLLTLALILDWYVGDPDFVWRRVPHPVVIIGQVIDWTDKQRRGAFANIGGNNADQRDLLWGFGLILVLLASVLAITWLIGLLVSLLSVVGFVAELFIVAVLIAQKSLLEHVQRVAQVLREEGLAGGRKAVSMIVGRDVSQLNESGVCKAAIESLAENFSDGVIAPVFWYAVLGLPGLLFYKAVNTADSMIGHRSQDYEYFGKPAAVLDDILNWPAARLTAVLVLVAHITRSGMSRAGEIWTTILSDAPTHRSPNAGWPESAFAAALGVALGGSRSYGDDIVHAPQLNAAGRSSSSLKDVDAALALYTRACLILILACAALWFFF